MSILVILAIVDNVRHTVHMAGAAAGSDATTTNNEDLVAEVTKH